MPETLKVTPVSPLSEAYRQIREEERVKDLVTPLRLLPTCAN